MTQKRKSTTGSIPLRFKYGDESLPRKLVTHLRFPRSSRNGRKVLRMMNARHDAMARWCLETAVDVSEARMILDVGCGGGGVIKYLLSESTGKVYGLDPSPAAVRQSRKENQKAVISGRVQIVQGAAEQAPFADKTFDLITAFNTTYFWQDFAASFTEILRILQPAGQLIIGNKLGQKAGNEHWIAAINMQILPPEAIADMLQRAGFESIKIVRHPESTLYCITACRPDSGE